MKKSLLYGVVLVSLGLMSGCTNSATTTTTVQSEQSTTETTQSAGTTSSTTQSSTTQESTTQESTTQQTTSSEHTAQINPAQALQAAFPNEQTPTDAVNHTQTMNIAVADEGSRFSVLYYDMAQPLVMNSKELNAQQPIAHFEKVQYASAEQAKAAVNQLNGQDGAMGVDLGYGITGYQQGAAGSTYLSWSEGKWSLYVQASNSEGEDPVPTAKEVVAFLEKNYLPAPNIAGQVAIHLNATGYQANQLTWQDNTIVYTVSNNDAIAALKMAVSMAK